MTDWPTIKEIAYQQIRRTPVSRWNTLAVRLDNFAPESIEVIPRYQLVHDVKLDMPDLAAQLRDAFVPEHHVIFFSTSDVETQIGTYDARPQGRLQEFVDDTSIIATQHAPAIRPEIRLGLRSAKTSRHWK